MRLAPLARSARSVLFVPGDRPDRFAKAIASGADLVVLDLEDAVGERHKDEARQSVSLWLRQGGEAAVRVNPPGTEWAEADMSAIAHTPQLVMLPKATAETCRDVLSRLPGGSSLIALVETAGGVLDARTIAAAPGVVRLALGHIDLSLELGLDPDDRMALLATRSSLVLAAAACGSAAPLDGVTVAFDQPERLREDLEHAIALGFAGKLCIHPRQVDVVHELLSPPPKQVERARRVLASAREPGAFALDGRMVDLPVVEAARRLIARMDRAEGR